MNNYSYAGPFAELIQEHVSLKQAIGYKYESEARHLFRFSLFTFENYPLTETLTKEIVLDWCSKKSYEAQANQCIRASIIRQLAVYMNEIGISAFILPKGYYPTETQYIPYIYTTNELTLFFAETDKCHYVSECPNRNLIMPVFFRLIYSCGLRCSEARLLKVGDVDLQSGIIYIYHAKNDNDRMIPLLDTMFERCRNYYDKVHLFSTPGDYFFPGLAGKPMTLGNVYHNFRRFLWKAEISHGGRGKGPRIQDFRHSFACHCLKKWVMQGKDLNAYLPVLKTFMGHASFDETAYYLRMTADIYPDIIVKLEGCFPDIIPSIKGGAYENN